MTNHNDLAATFANKVRGYTAHQCERAMQDCHATLRVFADRGQTDPYITKLWTEIDAIRDRQMVLSRKGN